MGYETCPECGDDEGAWQVVEYDSDEDAYYYLCTDCKHTEWVTDDTETWK